MGNDVATVIADFLRRVPVGQENVLAIADQDLGDGVKGRTVSLQNRELQPEPPKAPERAESPRRAHVFHDALGFAAYLARYGGDDTVVLADAPTERVRAILNEKAEKGFEAVAFQPQKHPLFTPWLAVMGTWLPLRKAIDFLLDNRRMISQPDGKQLARDLSQIKISKKIDRMQGLGTKSINGIMIETTIAGQSKTQAIELPEDLTVDVPMYIGCQPVALSFDLSIDSSEEHGVIIRMSSPDILVKATEQFDQFVEQIRQGMGGKGTIGLGAVMHAGWDYLEQTLEPQ